jgi:hypothetical protein
MTGQTWTSSDAPRQPSFRTLWTQAVGDSDLHATTKLVGYALATWMDVDGHCWPSLAAISRRASLKNSAVCDHLNKLADAGLLRRDKGPGHSTRYQGLSATADKGVRQDGVVSPSGRSRGVRGGGHEVSSRSSHEVINKRDEWEKPNPEPQRRSDEKCKECGLFTKHQPWCGKRGVVAGVAKSGEEA